MIATLIVAVLLFAIVAILATGLLGIFATPTPPSKKDAADRLADAPNILATVFDGNPNASFTRKLWEPITEDMVLDAANRHGYRLVSKVQVLSDFTYHFTRV